MVESLFLFFPLHGKPWSWDWTIPPAKGKQERKEVWVVFVWLVGFVDFFVVGVCLVFF